jgi:hypothetical protein
VTREEVTSTISAYGAGLEAELSLLRQLQRLAALQREATIGNEMALLPRIGDERERLMAGLVEIEHQIEPLRRALAGAVGDAATRPGFEDVVALHRAASQLVSTILSADRETAEALRNAEVARRVAVQAIEHGETTLAAYRRVIAPPLAGAALVDRVG